MELSLGINKLQTNIMIYSLGYIYTSSLCLTSIVGDCAVVCKVSILTRRQFTVVAEKIFCEDSCRNTLGFFGTSDILLEGPIRFDVDLSF